VQLTGTIAAVGGDDERLEDLVVIETERLGRLPTEITQRLTALVLEYPELDTRRFEDANRRRHAVSMVRRNAYVS
jgi:hypothetical protein